MDTDTRSLYWAGKDDDGLPVEQGTNHLLVVGVDTYADEKIANLSNAVQDAQDIARMLVDDFGFDLPESRALYNEQATKAAIMHALETFEAGENDNVILYFAGHGYYHDRLKRGFFVPADGKDEAKANSFLKHADIQDYIAAINARHIFLLMDSCFSGGMFRGGRANEKEDFERAARNRERLRSRLCLTSGQFNEKVSDGYVGNNSPFARAVLQYLGHEQMVFSGDLIRHIVKTVPNNANQQPDGGVLQMVDDHRGEMILRRARRDSELLNLIHKADWSEKAALVNRFIELFPKSEYIREVRKIGIQVDDYLTWSEVNQRSEHALALFIDDNPKSLFIADAQRLKNDLAAKRKAQAINEALLKVERERKAKEAAEQAERERIEIEAAEAIRLAEAERKAKDAAEQAELERKEKEAAEVIRLAEAEQAHKRREAEEKAEANRKAAEAARLKPTSEIIGSRSSEFLAMEQKAEEAITRKKVEEYRRKPFMETVSGVSFTMCYIPGGTYQMGDVMGDKESSDETVLPARVADFYLAETVVTQALYEAVMKTNPSHFKGKDLPVEMVSWEDAQAFIKKLNAALKQQGKPATYRLPTEAEWEYAAREGGKKVRFGNGKNIADPKEINFWNVNRKESYSVAGEYRKKTTPVKTFKPNALGLHDMSGNVWEWCQDWYATYPQSSGAGPATGSARMLRGGSWYDRPQSCRTAYRHGSVPGARDGNCGFRLCLPV